jgi:hypothetical protein
MGYNVYPKYLEDAAKTHWTVKMLYAFGVLQIILCTLIGAVFARPICYSLWNVMGASLYAPDGIVALLGALIGLMIGIVTSVGIWAAALVIDDIHTMRLHSQAYIVVETNNPHLGK